MITNLLVVIYNWTPGEGANTGMGLGYWTIFFLLIFFIYILGLSVSCGVVQPYPTADWVLLAICASDIQWAHVCYYHSSNLSNTTTVPGKYRNLVSSYCHTDTFSMAAMVEYNKNSLYNFPEVPKSFSTKVPYCSKPLIFFHLRMCMLIKCSLNAISSEEKCC